MKGLFFGILWYHLMLSGNFCCPESSHWILGGILGGVNFGPGIFWGVVWSPNNFLGVLIFAPIRSSLSLEIPSPQGFCDRYYSNQIGCIKPFRNHLFPRPSIVITGFIIAHVQYIKILTWPRGFLVIFLVIFLFFCAQVSPGNCETMELQKNLQFSP